MAHTGKGQLVVVDTCDCHPGRDREQQHAVAKGRLPTHLGFTSKGHQGQQYGADIGYRHARNKAFQAQTQRDEQDHFQQGWRFTQQCLQRRVILAEKHIPVDSAGLNRAAHLTSWGSTSVRKAAMRLVAASGENLRCQRCHSLSACLARLVGVVSTMAATASTSSSTSSGTIW